MLVKTVETVTQRNIGVAHTAVSERILLKQHTWHYCYSGSTVQYDKDAESRLDVTARMQSSHGSQNLEGQSAENLKSACTRLTNLPQLFGSSPNQ